MISQTTLILYVLNVQHVLESNLTLQTGDCILSLLTGNCHMYRFRDIHVQFVLRKMNANADVFQKQKYLYLYHVGSGSFTRTRIN
jgi:hypothetical protein